MLTRREALKRTTMAFLGLAAASHTRAQTSSAPAEPFALPPLPYPVDALEPHIDARTMEIHHQRHHGAYVANLNKAVLATPELQGRPLEEMLSHLDRVPESVRTTVRNHGGGHYNHTLFWQMMSPRKTSPAGELARALETAFGSLAAFQEQFTAAALRVFGSGWAWLVWQRGQLRILTTPNQDTPLAEQAHPLLGVDVWEHAYYLKYQNRRADYVAAWWNVVNWEFVAERYARRPA
ncbi:superoxide dismutase [Limisphaera sp. VF-2]|jgi:Fe-Mn family superoxide dismutase|uniref:superoxide dismutase n=1 Tax=Limisphaera sp. VF-2 TaxID=3400418 RepID=UPI0017713D8C